MNNERDHSEEAAPLSIPLGLTEPSATAGLLSRQFALISDIGQKRELNEDSAFALSQDRISAQGTQTFGLFIVADGMGGHASGERASQIAVQAASESLMREVALPLADPASELWRSVPISEAIERAFLAAHTRVQQEVAGGATTLTIVLLLNRRAYVGHAGDCRLYLWHQNTLTALTRDHSILTRLAELGYVNEAELDRAANDPRRNTLYRAIGQPGDAQADLFSRVLEPEDGLLLCSDGLWGSVPHATLLEIMTSAESPAVACRRLVDEANARGGPDNITAIVVRSIG